MMTPELEAAHVTLSAMDTDIQRAEANLRVLQALNSPMVLELSNKLQTAKKQRQEFLAAIENERHN